MDRDPRGFQGGHRNSQGLPKSHIYCSDFEGLQQEKEPIYIKVNGKADLTHLGFFLKKTLLLKLVLRLGIARVPILFFPFLEPS